MKPLKTTSLMMTIGLAGGLFFSTHAYATGALSGKQLLRDFILSSHKLKKRIHIGKIVELSRNRAEVYAEEDGHGYAVVAFRSKAKSFTVLPKLCNTALTRKYLRPVIKDLKKYNIGSVEIEETLKIYSSKVRLKGVEQIGQRTEGKWKLYGCRVPLDKVQAFEYDGNPKEALALANYRIAKKNIKDKKYNLALKSLKKTTADPEVYKNSVAFIVPMIAANNYEMASKIEDEYLDFGKISDPDAIYFFGGFLVKSKRLNDAELVFERCIDVDKENRKCQKSLEDTRQKLEEDEMRESTNFDAFFSE